MLVGPSLMLLNKHIMQGIGFDYPLTLSLLGLLSSSLYSRTLVCTGFATVRPESLAVVAGSKWYRTALPIAICKAMTLAAGNAVYLHLGLSVIQMLKAFTPCTILIVMKMAGMPAPSRSAVAFVMIIVFGTLIEVQGEMHHTIVGLLLALCADWGDAVNLVLTQKLLQNSKFSVIEGMYVLATPGAVCLMLAAMVLEWPRMLRANHQYMLLEYSGWFVAAAFLGLIVNFLGFLLVQATSSLTAKILNTARSVALVLVGVLFYGEVVMPMELAGYSLALMGFVGYNFVQIYPEKGQIIESTLCRRCFLEEKQNAHIHIKIEELTPKTEDVSPKVEV